MEAATEKKRRGRPSIDEHSDGIVKAISDSDTQDQTHRAHVNKYYETAGSIFVGHRRDDIPHYDTLIQPYRDSFVPKKTGRGVLEQLGRMIEQDGYRDTDVLHIAIIAADALHQGLRVKEVERFIRRGRTKDIWTWETEAASKNQKLSDDDLRMIHKMLCDYGTFAEDNVASGCDRENARYYLAVTKVLPDLLTRIENILGDDNI
mgnify:CR=1 FL=1